MGFSNQKSNQAAEVCVSNQSVKHSRVVAERQYLEAGIVKSSVSQTLVISDIDNIEIWAISRRKASIVYSLPNQY